MECLYRDAAIDKYVADSSCVDDTYTGPCKTADGKAGHCDNLACKVG